MPTKSGKAGGSAKSGYWHESARPLESLVFVTPMLLFYEVGVLLLGPQAIRNAADVWLRQLLDLLGFGQYFLLPILTCGLLLGWHHVTRQSWRLNWNALYGMLFESIVFGLFLVLIAGWQGRFFAASSAVCAVSESGGSGVFGTLVAYVGAGIYEEVLFRLMLLPGVWGLLRLAGLSTRASMATAVVVTSLVFSAAHYQFDFTFAGYHFTTAYGEAFAWSSFCFRFLAGVAFSLLFLLRGFGVTAGAHAMYDLLTLLI
jgi:membrane protease YdiL (CAAX protease family)